MINDPAIINSPYYRPTVDQERPFILRGCVIRFDTKNAQELVVPRIHLNTTHIDVGVAGVEVLTNGDLQLTLDTVDPVISVVTESDETLARKGIRGGGSGGGGQLTIRLYQHTSETKVRADSPTLYDLNANLWVTIHSYREIV